MPKTKRKVKRTIKVKKAKPKVAPTGAKLPPKGCAVEEEHEFDLFI